MTDGASPTMTAGEQVFKKLYKDVCEERDVLANTNAMYARMLEACATQNSVAEAAANAARQAAAESLEQAEKSRVERDAAILNLQRVTGEAAANVALLQATGAAVVAKLTADLAAAGTTAASGSGESAAAVQRLQQEVDELRALGVKNSTASAFQDRIVTLRCNETRQAAQASVVAADQLRAQLAAAADADIARLSSEVVKVSDERVALMKHATTLEGTIFALQSKLTDSAAAVAAAQSTGQTALAQLALQLQEAVTERDVAIAARDEAGAAASQEAQAAEFAAALATSNAAHNDAQNKLLDALNGVTFMHNNEMVRMTGELEAVSKKLAVAQDRNATLSRDLKEARRLNTTAAKNKNEALKEQHEKLSQLTEAAGERAAAATATLQQTQQLGGQAAAVFLAKLDEIKSVSINTTTFAAEGQAIQTAAEFKAVIAALEERLVARDAQLLQRDVAASEEVVVLRNTVAGLTSQLETVTKESFRSQLDKAHAEFAVGLAQASAMAQAQTAAGAEMIQKIQATMALNAAEVAAAASYKEQLQAAQRQLEANSNPGSTPVGQKRRR